jgi:integrase
VLALLRLGLRASEVARLGLDDIDWRCGEVTIRGKGGRSDQLPLPVEVGETIAVYLRGGRQSSSTPRLLDRHGSDQAAFPRRDREPRVPGL